MPAAAAMILQPLIIDQYEGIKERCYAWSGRMHMRLIRALFICSIIVVSFDALAAQLALMFAASYGAFIVPQICLYFAIGFSLRRRGIGWLALGALLLITSAVEASAGTKVAELIGPGKIPRIGAIGHTLAFLSGVLLTTVVGLLGGSAARYYRARTNGSLSPSLGEDETWS